MKVFIVGWLIVIVLAVILVWRTPLGKGTYKFGFLLGLVTFGSILLSRSSEFGVSLDRNPASYLLAFPLAYMATTPFVLLIEAGLSGYRGFSSWMRYLSLSLTVLGGVGLILAVLLPRFVRR